MREKSENEARDRYARRYAAVLAAEALIRFRAKGFKAVITVEAKDNPLWDDIVEVDLDTNIHHRHQVKRQQTTLPSESFAKYIQAAFQGSNGVEYHFAFPVLVEVSGAGDIRILRGLCERIKHVGAKREKVLANLRPAERDWVDCLTNWSGVLETELFQRLLTLHIDIIGFEEDLDRRAIRILEPVFGHKTEDAWLAIQSFVSDKDGVVEIDPETLSPALPAPSADEIDTFYWSFVEEVECSFRLPRWDSLSDNLMRNLLPQSVHDDLLAFAQSVQEAAWPGRYPEIDMAFKNLDERAHEYIAFFNTRSESDGKYVRENKDYKRVFPNPRYHEEVEAAKVWDMSVQKRLHNMVIALNELFAAVREHLKKTYRLRDGRLGISDSLGVRSQMEPMIHYPRKYIDLGD